MSQLEVASLVQLFQQCDAAIQSQTLSAIEEHITLCNEIIINTDDSNLESLKLIHYLIGNLWSEKSRIIDETPIGWKNNAPPIAAIQSINSYRNALNSPHLYDEKTKNYYYVEPEIKTNLANQLSAFCRSIEAIELWRLAFSDSSNGDAAYVAPFSTAQTLDWLSNFINDPGHAQYYRYEAHKIRKQLLGKVSQTSHPYILNVLNSDTFKERLDFSNAHFTGIEELEQLEAKPTCPTDESRYRDWCLNSNLFLNHLNDITTAWVASQDILQFPNHSVPIDQGPVFPSAFSAIKREYCFARFLAYEGMHGIHPSFENNLLFLTDSLDYVNYGGHIEKLKTALRLSFSIFDSLYTLMLWYFSKKKTDASNFSGTNIKQEFASIDNPFITALYWLACDLADNDKIPQQKWQAPNPDGKTLRKLRHTLEHKLLRVADGSYIWNNDFDFMEVITLQELEKLTLHTLKLSRSAMIYFILAVKYQEDNTITDKSSTLGQSTPLYKPFSEN